MIGTRRRDFIVVLGGAAAWPLLARAQPRERRRRIGVLMNLAADDPESQLRVAAFSQGLGELGLVIGRNVDVDYRWATGEADRRRFAAELLAPGPKVILASGSPSAFALQQATRTVPIVFANTSDPVGGGLVANLARPGGNLTGFTNFEYGISAKWLELLKQIAPRVTRAGVLRDPTFPTGIGQLAGIQAVAPSFGVELTPIDVRDADEIERAITEFARGPNNGLIVASTTGAAVHRDLIIALAARHLLPAVYPYRYYVSSGGLISYGPDTVEQYRLAASYVDRILKGEKPADLPVQAPTKYELVINLKTARALRLDVPSIVYARADEVIE